MLQSCSFCVIVVDDDADDRFIIEQAFRHYSPECQLQLLDNGAELLNSLASRGSLPSLILLDLNMPLLNGFETLHAIRQKATNQELPVVILTTSSEAQDQQQARQLKANDFISKPTTLNGYREVVLQLRHDWLVGRCQPLFSLD
ncbi:response regulator [Spirosoma daeguense]